MRNTSGKHLGVVLNRFDSPWIPTTIVALLYALFILFRLANFGFNPSSFVVAGDKYCDPTLVPANLVVLEDSDGYDGQFFYRIALDPFTTKEVDFGIRLDRSPYRHQRILYPLLVWLLSFGIPSLAPAAMILVNYVTLCIMAWLASLYSKSLSKHSLWGILLPLYPGFVLTLSRDLAEILEVCLLVAGLLCLRKSKLAPATILVSLAVFTKETALLVPVGALLLWCYGGVGGRRFSDIEPHFFIVPLLCYFFWQLVLFFIWQKFPIISGQPNIGVPLVGFLGFFFNVAGMKTKVELFFLVELIFVLAFAVGVFSSLRSTKNMWQIEKLAWVLYGILLLHLTQVVWVEDWAYFRAMSEFYVLGTMILLTERKAIKAPLFLFALILWSSFSLLRSVTV